MKSNCFVCRKRKAETLPLCLRNCPLNVWVTDCDPFSYCGVDSFGPFHIAVRRSTEKRWCFLFTCVTTRSIHIEVVPSLDASSCVMGIDRSIFRRGEPSIICSDNGTNFVGTDKEFLVCLENWNKKAPSFLLSGRLNGCLILLVLPTTGDHGSEWCVVANRFSM